MTIGLIYAVGQNSAFGLAGKLPWNIAEDMAFFKRVTEGHAVIMGRKTWDSLPECSKPLPNRTNIVISRTQRQSNYEDGVYFVQDIHDALTTVKTLGIRQTWVIGGPSIIQAAEPWADIAYITSVMYKGKFDVSAPHLNKKEWSCTGVPLVRPIKKGQPAFNIQVWRHTKPA